MRLIALLFLLSFASAFGQTIVNCSGTSGSGAFSAQTGGAIAGGCGVSPVGNQSSNWALSGTANSTPVSGGVVTLVPGGSSHWVVPMIYQTPVNVQAFSFTVQFNFSGQCIAFMLENNNNPNVDGGSTNMIGGASAECGVYQGYGTTSTPGPSPNYIWSLVLNGYNGRTATGSYDYSSVKISQTYQPPYVPGDAENIAGYTTNDDSTSPVPLNIPNTQGAGSTDTYSITVGYDGATVSMCLYDVTAANGNCTSSTSGTGTYFLDSWSNVSIPSIVGSTTAYFGITESTGEAFTNPLAVVAAKYTVNSATGTPSFTAWNANYTYNNGTLSAYSPVYSIAPGSYTGTQTVTMTTTGTPNNYICYEVLAAGTTPTYYPQPNNYGGCAYGTKYGGAVTITSSSDVYAVAGSNLLAFSAVTEPSGLGPPSTIVKGTYTINATPAATPTFSPAAGTYVGSQNVTISTTAGSVICYNTTGSPATNQGTGCTTGTVYTGPVSVTTSETLYAVAGGTGYADSTVGSAAYTITSVGHPANIIGKAGALNKTHF